jgi:hypothetical protein
MSLIQETSRRDALSWRQKSAFKRNFELAAGNRALASLNFEKVFGGLASGEFDGCVYKLVRSGILQPRVVVTDHEGRGLARFRANWTGGGTVDFEDGTRLVWKPTNFWKSEWGFVAADREPVIRFFQQLGVFRSGARVSVPVEGPHIPILALLGWYLLVLWTEEAERREKAAG